MLMLRLGGCKLQLRCDAGLQMGHGHQKAGVCCVVVADERWARASTPRSSVNGGLDSEWLSQGPLMNNKESDIVYSTSSTVHRLCSMYRGRRVQYIHEGEKQGWNSSAGVDLLWLGWKRRRRRYRRVDVSIDCLLVFVCWPTRVWSVR